MRTDSMVGVQVGLVLSCGVFPVCHPQTFSETCSTQQLVLVVTWSHAWSG